MNIGSYYTPVALIIALLSVGVTHAAPVSDAKTQTDDRMNGSFIVTLGEKFNNPLLRLIGQMFIDNDINQAVHGVEQKLNEQLCRLHPCSEWMAWSDCPAKGKGKFDMVTRSRVCNKTTNMCDFGVQTEYTDTESKLCEGDAVKQIGAVEQFTCPVQYTVTNGFCLKVYTTRTDKAGATQTCQNDGGHVVNVNSRSKADALHGLLSSNGITSEEIWINGERTTKGGPWTYTYESSLSYDYWHSTEPTDGADDLCTVDNSSPRTRWDRGCDNDYQYVCEVVS